MRLLIFSFVCLGALAIYPTADGETPRRTVGFAAGPKLIRSGDEVVITFTAATNCVVTVAVEDAAGRIIRHLASGLLGPNAPPPLRRASLQQRLVWDGKDDLDQYVEHPEQVTFRIALGLRSRFEKAVAGSPYKRVESPTEQLVPPLFCARPEGVYVLDGIEMPQVRLFDHEGRYLRTIYPFPAKSLARIQGIRWNDGAGNGIAWPLKHGDWQSTLLTVVLSKTDPWPTRGGSTGATALGAFGDVAYLFGHRVNRLPVRSSDAWVELAGPATAVLWQEGERVYPTMPTSVAFSPDSQRVYLTGYSPPAPFWQRQVPAAVFALDLEKGTGLDLFAGEAGEKFGSAPGNQKLVWPTSVACDAQGRVYVADYLADQIHVFLPEGTPLTRIATVRPVQIRIAPESQELYVFSWFVFTPHEERPAKAEARLRRYAPLAPGSKLPMRSHPECTLDAVLADLRDGYGRMVSVEVDFWTKPPRIWFSANKCRATSTMRETDGQSCFYLRMHTEETQRTIRILSVQEGKPKLIREFADELTPGQRELPVGRALRLHFSPAIGKLVLHETDIPFSRCWLLDPRTGHCEAVELPFPCADMAVQPLTGYVHLRSAESVRSDTRGGTGIVARYDPLTWHEIPFNYGIEHPQRFEAVICAIPVPAQPNHLLQGGMTVTAHGVLAVATHAAGPLRLDGPAMAVHIWDRDGKLVHENALPGLRSIWSLGMDIQNRLHVLVPEQPAKGERNSNPQAGTLIKAGPDGAIMMAEETATVSALQELKDSRGERVRLVGAEWIYSGCGVAGAGFVLDGFGRVFVAEPDRYRIAVLDAAGNLILTVGEYGNVDDGNISATLTGEKSRQVAQPALDVADTSRLKDGIALFHPTSLTVDDDRWLFVADPGNAVVLGVGLEYESVERIPFTAIPISLR